MDNPTMVIAQWSMVLTLVLMLSRRAPLYLTAIVGSALTALIAGFPLAGNAAITLTKMVNAGLHPVIADMAGVLLFIGAMEASGLLDVIVRDIVRAGNRLGGGPGVAIAGGIAAGCIGSLTGFTQPAIMAVATGNAAVRIGVDPSKVAAVHGHAGHLGNLAGFTHPTQVAIIAAIGAEFGIFNIYGAIIALSVFAASFFRLTLIKNPLGHSGSPEEMRNLLDDFENREYVAGSLAAFTPFLALIAGFVLGLPIFLVGVASAILATIIAGRDPKRMEAEMIAGAGRIATPLLATISFLFLSTVIRNIGLVHTVSEAVRPILSLAPVQTMLLVASLTALMTQSYSASAVIIIPFLEIVLDTGADPMAAGLAAASGGALMQYFLTGGPVAALATVIPVIPGSSLRTANRFQRSSILVSLAVALALTTALSL